MEGDVAFGWFHVIAGVIGGYLLCEIRHRGGKKLRMIRAGTHSLSGGNYKLIFCVRTDLKMTKGKIAAQCGHATLGAYQSALIHNPNAVAMWESNAQPKIALQIKSLSEAESIQRIARSKGVSSYAVYDAGRTQIAAGSLTVVAVGPGPSEVIDQITRHLKLL
uniref:peptidyl-tRNA hydrolase n=1 Tax=Timspurckia oligopyrenoides TaxID=708627 RepID=A0A6T6PRY8_9RHOD